MWKGLFTLLVRGKIGIEYTDKARIKLIVADPFYPGLLCSDILANAFPERKLTSEP